MSTLAEQDRRTPTSNDDVGMLTTAAATVPLWASIALAVVPLVISALALRVGWMQQKATLGQQATQHAEALKQQHGQLVATIALQRNQQTESLSHDRDQQARTLEHERQQADLRDVRSVLDDAARVLTEADLRHRAIFDDLGNAEKREALKQAGRNLDVVRQRLAIRFGTDHEVTAAMAKCVDLTLHAFGATLHWDLKDHDYAREQAKRAMNEFEPAWTAFIDAATRRAGVDLPG